MQNNSEIQFSDYKNFEFGDSTPKLPLEKSDDISKGEIIIHNGGFASTIEIDDNNVVKLNRLIRLSTRATPGTSEVEELKLSKKDANEYLVDQTENKSEVVGKMLELAKEKMQVYEILGKYIGEFLPEIKFFSVVESPRRTLENSSIQGQNRTPSQEILNQIPESEITLMEVWENINPKNRLGRGPFEEVLAIYKDTNFESQLKRFAQKTYELFIEEGLMLDICDAGGIRVKKDDGKELSILTIEDTQHMLEVPYDRSIPLPRNTAFSKGNLKYFDTYPVDKIKDFVNKAQLTTVLEAFKANDWIELSNFAKNPPESERDKMLIIRYVALLKKFGAEI